MPAAIRKSVDNSTGHCYTPRPANSGSPDVWVNDTQGGDQAVRAEPSVCTDTETGGCVTYDHYQSHCCGDDCHDGCAQKGSPNVFVNCQAFHRNGDAISCGDTANNGSSNVFINSGYGDGALIDNNPPIVNLQDNDAYTPPVGVSPTPLTEATMTDVYVYENNDVQEELNPPPANAQVLPMETVAEDPIQPPPNIPPVQDCSTVDALPANYNWSDGSPVIDFSTFAAGFALSPNFTVADLCFTAVSHYEFSTSVTQNSGLTQKEILKNMCHHAKTVLEPMLAAYGPFTITSGFRNKSGGSQHNKGQATDIQFLNFHSQSNTGELYYQKAQNIRDDINFDQMILEWFGRNPWIHISSNYNNHRKNVLTQTGSSSYSSGLKLLRHN